MRTVTGDLLDAPADYLLQQCNCLTVRSHGLSAAIDERYPYAALYGRRRPIGARNLAIPEDRSTPGTFVVCEGTPTDPKVVALFCQWRPGKIGTTYFNVYPESTPRETKEQRLIWFWSALDSFGASLDPNKVVSVAVPYQIGCGLAGGNWTEYSNLLEKFQAKYSDRVAMTVYKLD